MTGLIALPESVVFDAPTSVPDGFGGTQSGWTVPPDSYACRAAFIYQRGSEAVDAARLAGLSIYKVRIRSCNAARDISPAWRMRDARRGTEYNIREVDAITDRHWVWIVVESGVGA